MMSSMPCSFCVVDFVVAVDTPEHRSIAVARGVVEVYGKLRPTTVDAVPKVDFVIAVGPNHKVTTRGHLHLLQATIHFFPAIGLDLGTEVDFIIHVHPPEQRTVAVARDILESS